MLTLKKYYMARDEKYKSDLTPEIQANAQKLIDKVNALLKDLGWEAEVTVSSGWRPMTINNRTPNASKTSPHLYGMAVDLLDTPDQKLGKLILEKEKSEKILAKHGLWMEDLDHTRGKWTNWVHLDFKERSSRPVRVFKPN